MAVVVLAFSGGLDTSYCVKYLSEARGLTVHTVTVNTGGFTPDELARIGERARSLGAAHHETVDATATFYRDCVRYLVYGNVLRNGTYPLSVSAERLFQARAVAMYGKEVGAAYLAHGSTGAGNDQVRFDVVFRIVHPAAEILTPIRDQSLSRQAEIDYLRAHGVDGDWSKAAYSINQGLWGTSVGGVETLNSRDPLPESAWPTPVTHTNPRTLELHFTRGELTGLDKQTMPPVEAIRALHALAQPYGIGRDIHVGDTIIGIKGRVGFEAAAPLLTIKAHHLLEKHTLSKWQLFWKDQLANWYGTAVHEGQLLDPVMRDLEAFLESTQAAVSGTVFCTLHPYRFTLDGIESPYNLMRSDFGSYGEENRAWTGEDARGFAKIASVAGTIYESVRQRNSEDGHA